IALKNAARAGGSYAIMNSYTSAQSAAWQAAIQQAARDEMYQQTGYVSGSLTTATSVTLEASGTRRRVRVVATYASFNTIFSWPWLPDSIDLRSAVDIYAIR